MEQFDLQEFVDKVHELLDNKNFRELKTILNDEMPQDIALLLEELPDKVMPPVFRLLTKENAADVFIEMSTDSQEHLLSVFSDAEVKAVFEEMFLDDVVDVIEEMPASVVKRIINQADAETRSQINQILQYKKDSAGTIMTVEYVSLKAHWTVKECFDRIRKIAVDKESIYTCYVTDEKRKLLGVVTVKDMLLNSYETVIGDIMEEDVIFCSTNDDKEQVALTMSKYDLYAIPVVDGESRVVGIITIDDVLDVIEEEATEDIAMMTAGTPTNEAYLEQSVWDIWKSRIPWLLILMISATFTGIVINAYESKLSALLFACVPMLMGTGGNAGGQSSVSIIRALSLNQIDLKDIFKVMFKEFRISILCAIVLGVCNFVKMLIFDRVSMLIALSVCLTLCVTVVIAKLIGCVLPIFAKKLGFDPAVMASPFITTIVDACSLLIYFRIASALLGI